MSSHYPRSIPAILLCLYIFLLIALMFAFSPLTYAAAFSSQDSSFQQDIERAGVSVVRLIATYSPSSGNPLAPGQHSSKTASSNKTFSRTTLTSSVTLLRAYPSTGNGVTCTGLGFIVASWGNTTTPPTTAPTPTTPTTPTPATAASPNTWIMTDATLITRSGRPTASSCSSIPNTSSLTLSSIKVIFSSKFNSTLAPITIPVSNQSILCGLSITSTCSTGPVLVGFSDTRSYPFLDVFQASSNASVSGIVLSSSASMLAVPTSSTPSTTNNPAQFIAPYKVTVRNIASPQFDSISRTQFGMPIVDAQGFLQGMYASAATGPAGSLPQPIIPNILLQTILSNKNIDPKAHPNTIEDDWNNGITDYAQGRSFYAQAHQDFADAFQQNNTFSGANVYAHQTASSSGSSNGNTTVPPGTQPGGIQLPLLGYVPFWLFVLGITGIIILFILLVFLNALFRRGHKRNLATKQGVHPMNEGEAQQARTAPSASFVQQPVPQQILQMPQLPQEMSPALHMMHNGSAGSALPPVSSAQSAPNALNAPIAPIAPFPTMQRSDIENQPTLVNLTQSTPPDEQLDGDITIPIGKFVKSGTQQVEHAKELGFEIVTNTNAGLKRMHKPNEDSIFAVHGVRDLHGTLQQVGLFIVADGMGGHADGKVASTLAIQTVINHVLPRLMHHQEPLDDPAQLLSEGVQKANYAVHLHNMENHADMGTTVTTTMLVGTNAYIANVGDSRTYLYRYPDGLNKVTRDHSVVASLVDAGIIKEEDIYTHTKRNQIYRSLGEKPYVEIDTFAKSLQSGDKLLLCSDGMWEMVRDPKIRHILEEPVSNSQEMGIRLIQAALDGGGEDNVSVIVVNVLESPNYMMQVGLEPIYVQEEVQLPALG